MSWSLGVVARFDGVRVGILYGARTKGVGIPHEQLE